MARRKKDDGTEALVWILTICTVGIIFLIKWTIEFIVWLVKTIANAINKASNKSEKKRNINNITSEPFTNTTIKDETLKMPSSEIKEKLGIFDKSIYDEDFPIQIRARGESYFENNKIKYYKNTDNKYTCTVKGTEDYKVSVTFEEDSDVIKEVSCSCPYYADKNNYCKHIYALLYKVKCSDNKDKLINEINEYLKSIKTMINNSQNYINRNSSKFTNSDIEEYNRYIHKYDWQLNNIEGKLNNNTLEDTLMNYLEQLIRISVEFKERISYTINSERTANVSQTTTSKKSTNSSGVGGAIVGLALMDALSNRNDEDDDNVSGYTDDELDNYGLEDWQKEEVKKGNYDPWNFEEEELEEDDYYYDDDE